MRSWMRSCARNIAWPDAGRAGGDNRPSSCEGLAAKSPLSFDHRPPMLLLPAQLRGIMLWLDGGCWRVSHSDIGAVLGRETCAEGGPEKEAGVKRPTEAAATASASGPLSGCRMVADGGRDRPSEFGVPRGMGRPEIGSFGGTKFGCVLGEVRSAARMR